MQCSRNRLFVRYHFCIWLYIAKELHWYQQVDQNYRHIRSWWQLPGKQILCRFTLLGACHIKRERQNRIFKDTATKGQCSIGWFFGFKLHLIINDKGEILDFMLSQGNVGDRKPLQNKSLHKKVFGKLFGDKGYISQTLFE